jgi:AcrR family transcriptional regulator
MTLPLIYNLFGSKDQDDSLVLDYDDMYKMLQSALGEPGLPIKLLRKLREARTYIFLGFQFDKWYSQLLLKLLKDDSEQDKLISINNPLEDTDTRQFIIQQFDIKFMGDQFDFFGELYKRCDKENILRGISDDTLCPEAVAILKCVAIGEIDNALDALHNAARGKDGENEVIHLKGRYTRLENDKHKTDSRDYRTELAKILDTIIELTKNVCP